MLVSILTPYYTPDPRTPEARAELAAFFDGLAVQPGPCEILMGAATPARHDHLTAIVDSLLGEAYPHEVQVFHRGFDPARERPASRGQGVNDAAQGATGQLYLILHVDNRLPAAALDRIRAARRQGYRCGAFPKTYQPRPNLLVLQEWWLNHWRLGICRQTVGTNAVWLDRELWRPLPTGRILEDVALSNRLRRQGLHIAGEPVIVSSEKYLRTGLLASIAINAAVLGLQRVLRVHPDRLADELYSRRRLGVGEPGFWRRYAVAIACLVREILLERP